MLDALGTDQRLEVLAKEANARNIIAACAIKWLATYRARDRVAGVERPNEPLQQLQPGGVRQASTRFPAAQSEVAGACPNTCRNELNDSSHDRTDEMQDLGTHHSARAAQQTTDRSR